MSSRPPISGDGLRPFTAGSDAREYRGVVREVLADWNAATSWEREGHLPAGVFAALGRAGCFRSRWDAGRSGGLVHTAVLAEELSLVSTGLGLGVCLHNEVFLGVLRPLARTDRQRAILERALDGDVIGCFASTEAAGGSDIGALTCRARRYGAGWHVRGEKRFTSNACVATHAVVLARIDGDGAGVAPFILELGSDGMRVDGRFSTLGLRACDTSQLTVDVRVPADALLGEPRLGIVHVQRALQMERLAATVQALTGAAVSLRLARAFARSRRLRDQPLMARDVIRHRLADLSAQLAAAEALLGSTLESAVAGQDTTRAVAATKLIGAGVANLVVNECLQTLGGRGYLDAFPLEGWWRDVRLARIGGGTDDVMRDIIAGGIDRPDPPMDQWLREMEQATWMSDRSPSSS
jgi:alkylation response protein AidB-like acyl-CoA dehydrogenase